MKGARNNSFGYGSAKRKMRRQEHCRTITQVPEQSCCGRTDTTLLKCGFQLDPLLNAHKPEHMQPIPISDLRKIRLAPGHPERNCFLSVWNVLCSCCVCTIVARIRISENRQSTNIVPKKISNKKSNVSVSYDCGTFA